MDELRKTQMQSQTKPTGRSSKIVSIVTAINCLGTFLIGRLWIDIIIGGSKLSTATQRDQDGVVAYLVLFLYLIFSIIALNFWSKGKRFWDFILLGLASLHFAYLYYLFVFVLGGPLSIFSIPLVLDIVILLTVIIDKRYSKTRNLQTG